MVIGLSLYNKSDFANALDQLAKAEAFSGSRAAARQWSKYVLKERDTFEARKEIAAAP